MNETHNNMNFKKYVNKSGLKILKLYLKYTTIVMLARTYGSFF